MKVLLWASLFASAVVGCSSGGMDPNMGPQGSGSITGGGSLASWTKVGSSHWVAKPDMGSPPVILFVFESVVDCSAMTTVGWDVAVKGPILELDVWENGATGPMLTGGTGPLLGASPITAPRTFTIGGTADASYLMPPANPDASGGKVTIDALTPAQNVKGSFDIMFPASGGATGPASVKGSFDATWCAAGVEP